MLFCTQCSGISISWHLKQASWISFHWTEEVEDKKSVMRLNELMLKNDIRFNLDLFEVTIFK